MIGHYGDIVKVWGVNSLALVVNEGIRLLTDWNDIVQAGLTTLLLIVSLGYTFYKLLNERNKHVQSKEERDV